MIDDDIKEKAIPKDSVLNMLLGLEIILKPLVVVLCRSCYELCLNQLI